MENFWGTGVTRFVALYAEDRAARLVLWEPDQKAEGILKVGDLQSSQVSAHSPADTGEGGPMGSKKQLRGSRQ